MRQWYELPLGQNLRACERQRLEEILPNLFGYHLLQVGAMADGLLSASRVLHRVVMAVGEESSPEQAGLCGDPARLPISGDSLDALVLYHTLDFASDPHQVLREAERVLVAEGSIVILGFNPWSLWGLWHGLARRRGGVPWCGRFVSLSRLRDWLSLLGFEVQSTGQLFQRPPLQRPALLERLAFMEGTRLLPGGVYVLVARKKVITMTPVKPRWRPRRSLVSGLADTASRNAARVQTTASRRG